MKSRFKGLRKVWTDTEKGDRSCLVVSVENFEKIIIDGDVEIFLKDAERTGQKTVVMLLPRHVKVKRSKIRDGE